MDRCTDIGPEAVTKDPKDRGRFKTPSLRNVALTWPYMHDGSVRSLADVVEFYDAGGVRNPTLDIFVMPLELTDDEQKDLVTFLDALTGSLPKIDRPVHVLPSNGVESRPRSTMSNRNPSAQTGSVNSRSNFDTSRWRARSSGTDCMIGSKGNSGSFGKYICVTSRDWNDVPNSEKWMCAGRQALW
jgi:hypothetical protein